MNHPKSQLMLDVMTELHLTVNQQFEQLTLAGVAQWIEHEPENQRVTGSIPSQGMCLGCRPGPH